jgi:alpha-tubulin suppressor-like RCC1 family protein
MARRQGGTLGTFTPLSTPNAPTDLSVSTSIGSASVSFTAPTDTGDGAVTSYIVTAIDESTGASSGTTGSASPITISPGSGTFKIRAQAVNGFGPGRLTEFSTGNSIVSGVELYSWGRGTEGQLGDGAAVTKSSPVQTGALTDWSQASFGWTHVGGVKTDGTLWMWGYNSYGGALGDNTTVNKSSPVQIGAETNWYQVSPGQFFTAAIKNNNTLWTWGINDDGRLGTNEFAGVDRSSPVQVGSLTNWYQVSASAKNAAAIKTDGTMWSWGFNNAGALGDETADNKSSPVQIGALTVWHQMSMGYIHGAAIRTNGTLWTWGYNLDGPLGQNNTTSRSSPVQVGSLSDWAYVAAGGRTTHAVKTDGTLWAWGANGSGHLGDNTLISRSSPVQIGALTNWLRISTTKLFDFSPPERAVAVKTDGTLWAWGKNSYGAIGDGTTVNRSSPVQVGALTTWREVSASGHSSLALLGVI